jgi:hypothetical protein
MSELLLTVYIFPLIPNYFTIHQRVKHLYQYGVSISTKIVYHSPQIKTPTQILYFYFFIKMFIDFLISVDENVAVVYNNKRKNGAFGQLTSDHLTNLLHTKIKNK